MKHISKSIILFSLSICMIFSCQTMQKKTVKEDKEEWNVYQNEYLSMEYPSSYTIEGNFDIGVDKWEKCITDSNYQMNQINVFPRCGSNDSYMKPELRIIMSRQAIQLPLREFANFSVFTKQYEDHEVILASDIDSLSFAGLPALAMTFAYPQETGDTLLQRQIIVQQPDYKLFYINIICNEKSNYAEKLAPIYQILETFKFKSDTIPSATGTYHEDGEKPNITQK